MSERIYASVDNYIFMTHTGKFLCFPVYPENIGDNMQASFSQTMPLARSAPIFSYSNSGPRIVNFDLKLHRDIINQINMGVSNIVPNAQDDYLDSFINAIHALSVPEYTDATKLVNPPLCCVRIADQIFIKGVMQTASLSYELPLIQTRDGKKKYAVVNLSFSISEFDAYTATYLQKVGSFRGLTSSLERKIQSISGNQSALEILDASKTYVRAGGRKTMSYANLSNTMNGVL